MAALSPDVVADLRQENARLQAELSAARDRQNASAEILAAIAGASGDAKQALQLIAETTARLFGAPSVTIRLVEGSEWGPTINFGPSSMRIGAEVPAEQRRLGARNLPGTIVRENRQIHVPDLDNVDPSMAAWPMMTARAAGTRTVAGTPLRREGKAIGALIVFRDRLAPFTAEELALQQSFADQAVIALENARLFNETRQSLARQTATSDILRVISGSPTDVQPVFDAIVLTAARLLRCDRAFIQRCDGAAFWTVASAGQEGPLPISQSNKAPIDPEANFPSRAIVAKKTLHLPDWSVVTLPEHERRIHETLGINSALFMPLLREGECIGLLAIAGKQAGMFGASEIALAESFRDQALIAIENTRLFNKTQEALQRQTATAEILKVIASSPSDVQPVFDVIVERAVRLCGARMGRVYRYDGAVIQMVAGHGLSAPGLGKVQQVFPRPATDDTIAGQVMLSHRPYFVTDIQRHDSVPPLSRQMIEALGTRSQVTVPMLRTGEAIGAITVGWADPGAFGGQQVSLLQTFADQAVIAIENVRLFNETKEALERQTATAEILKVIASSPSNVQPVFEAIVGSAAKLFEPCSATITTLKDDKLHWNATAASISGFDIDQARTVYPIPFDPDRAPSARAILERHIVEIPDVTAPDTPEFTRKAATAGGFRSVTFVPLVDQEQGIGTIIFTHPQTGFRFSEKQLALIQTFADQAVIAIQNARLFNETREALERQTATSDILKVIAASPSDVQPVFDAIAASANRLIGGFSTAVFRFIDGIAHLTAFTPTTPDADEVLRSHFPRPVDGFEAAEMAQRGRPVTVTDTEEVADRRITEIGRARGFRSMLSVPLTNNGVPIGLISVTRVATGSFADHHVQLLQTFADQAVIAIENARLFNETKEALERQTATSDILKVIASSPSDVQPVFDAIAVSANRLIGGFSSTVFRFIDGVAHLKAFTPTSPAADEVLQATFPRPVSDFPPFQMAQAGEVTQIPDTEALSDEILNISRARGYRSMLFTPLMNDDVSIGFIAVTRVQPGNFADHHVHLLRTFADQAVIAIENVRLFDEVQARTRDLTEALTYQTGSGNILSVIASSPTDVGPVLKAIVESACKLCEAYDAIVVLKDGGDLLLRAHHGPIPMNLERWTNDRTSVSGRAIADQLPVHFRDILSEEGAELPTAQGMSRRDGCRTILGVPLLREGESIGTIVLRRTEVNPFSDKQIALLQTFADQAVIAIGNVRLFDEVQARTRDLTESLQQQTATADVLKVISRSTFDLNAVLKTLAESARELCDAPQSMVLFRDGDILRMAMQVGYPPEFEQYIRDNEVKVGPNTGAGRAAFTGQVAHFPDVLADPTYRFSEGQRFGGYRAMLSVPLLREQEVIGVFSLGRTEPGAFTERQIELVSTFADQAVIAIENTRLFEEVQERTRELSQSLDDLRTAQDRLVQTEKLASLGQLTAGIAHEIKNPLNFVNNFSALSAELTDELNAVLKPARLAASIREEVDELTGLLKDNLAKVVQHGRRADSIVKNMLLHSREGSGEHRPADINALVDESLNLAYHGARAEKPQFNVTLQRNFDPNAGMIEAFPQEITRVFLNLISNGFYAVTKRKADNGGTGFEPVVSATTKDRGDQVEIRIRDNGTGIPAEVKEKMFNPFFTTKPAGEGTGLGLSMSHDIIVKQHGGTIDVDTAPGQFTEFRIVLPRTSIFSNKSRG